MKKSPHQLRKKSDDKLRIDFHEPKTEFRRNFRKKPPKFVPLKLEIYLNYAFSLDLCCYNIVWTLTCFSGVCLYG